ncbi:MAG: sensor domain-containing diguanylate cyclase [Desulfitobacteriaceae bacterium]|nr:sensor domain-containing diguanylate cyclase [Desulfitobacteriaceae bacterium]
MSQPLDEYRRYKYVIENIKDIIWEMDTKLVFTFVSPTAKAMSGYNEEEMIGRSLLDFLSPESKTRIIEQWGQNLNKRIDRNFKATILYDVAFICKDGKTMWCEVSVKPMYRGKDFLGYIGTTRDISEKKVYENKLKSYVEELEYKNEQLEMLASLDMLTGAFNRRKFEHYIDLEIEKKENYGSPFSIIIFDIDNFKEINDSYGHKTGDRILKDITSLIKYTLRATDKLFRWGGDEFIILLPESNLKNAIKVANKIREAIQLFDFNIKNKRITISLGAGGYTLDENPEQFVARVDNALLRAKFSGKNKIEIS